MYTTSRDVTVAAGRASEYEARMHRMGQLVKQQPGFQVGILINSLGYPGRYTVLSGWDSREAARTWVESAAFKDFQTQHPANGTFTNTGETEAYELVLEAETPGQTGHYMTVVRWNIHQGQRSAFETSRQELFDLRKAYQKGFVRSRLFRFLGDPQRYLVGNTHTDRETARADQEIPALQEYARAHPSSNYASAPPSVTAYEVVDRVVP